MNLVRAMANARVPIYQGIVPAALAARLAPAVPRPFARVPSKVDLRLRNRQVRLSGTEDVTMMSRRRVFPVVMNHRQTVFLGSGWARKSIFDSGLFTKEQAAQIQQQFSGAPVYEPLPTVELPPEVIQAQQQWINAQTIPIPPGTRSDPYQVAYPGSNMAPEAGKEPGFEVASGPRAGSGPAISQTMQEQPTGGGMDMGKLALYAGGGILAALLLKRLLG